MNSISELARHLVLSGINVHFLVLAEESPQISAGENEKEFLFRQGDQGDKIHVFCERLQEMNQFAKVTKVVKGLRIPQNNEEVKNHL